MNDHFEHDLTVYRVKLQQRKGIWQDLFAKYESTDEDVEISVDNIVQECGIQKTKDKQIVVKQEIKHAAEQGGSSKLVMPEPVKRKRGRPRLYPIVENDCTNAAKNIRNGVVPQKGSRPLLQNTTVEDITSEVNVIANSLKKRGRPRKDKTMSSGNIHENNEKISSHEKSNTVKNVMNPCSFKRRGRPPGVNNTRILNSTDSKSIPEINAGSFKKRGRPRKHMLPGGNKLIENDKKVIKYKNETPEINASSFKKRGRPPSKHKQISIADSPKKRGRPRVDKNIAMKDEKVEEKPSTPTKYDKSTVHYFLNELRDIVGNETTYFQCPIDKLKHKCSIDDSNPQSSSNISDTSEGDTEKIDPDVLSTKYIIEEQLKSNIGPIMIKRCKTAVDSDNTYCLWHKAVKAELIRLRKVISLEKVEKYLQWYMSVGYKQTPNVSHLRCKAECPEE